MIKHDKHKQKSYGKRNRTLRGTLKEGHSDAYLAAAAALKQELVQTDGFLGAERFTSLASPGKLLSKSEWHDEQSVAKWRNTLRHRMAQTQGRLNDFADYKITVATPVRCYTLSSRDEAPNDSNRYFNL